MTSAQVIARLAHPPAHARANPARAAGPVADDARHVYAEAGVVLAPAYRGDARPVLHFVQDGTPCEA